MYKKILVPLDGSGLGECVFEHVRAVATGCHVPDVVFLYVTEKIPSPFESFSVPPRTENFQADWLKKGEQWGKEYVGKVAQDMKSAGVAAESAVLSGNPAEMIVDYAKKNGVDLIIMSTHGRSGPSRWAFGSVTDRVIRLSAAPVMVVRPAGCTV